LRGDFRVELNGQIVIDVPRSAYESTVSEFAVGENLIGSSGIERQFHGEILGFSRLPFPDRFVFFEDRQLRMRVRFPSGRLGLTEPLLVMGPHGRDGYCSVTYLPSSKMRFSVFSADGRVLAKDERMVDATRAHEMEFVMGRPDAGSTVPAIHWEIDGGTILQPSVMQPLSRPEAVATGMILDPMTGIEARFTGAELEIERSSPTSISGETYGPEKIIAMLPKNKIGHREPLLVSGVTGRGDLIYMIYSDAGHIQLGYDHWAVGGGLSAPIPVDYERPHEFVVALGSLFPDESDASWGPVDRGVRHRLKSEMTVRLDGRDVFKANDAAYPSTPDEVTPGSNQIGGSTCDAIFSGEIYMSRRLGLKPAATP
jgi:hypothetical protein